MIRPFDLRDIQLIRRLEPHSTCLDSRAALTQDSSPLQHALLAYLIGGRGSATLVLREREGRGRQIGSRFGRRAAPLRSAYGQLRLCPTPQSGLQSDRRRSQAQLVALAARPGDHQERLWQQMLDALTAQAGLCGAHSVVAEVADDSPESDLMRRSDFGVYSRQEILKLDHQLPSVDDSVLRPAATEDLWSIQQLIYNTVPRLVQLIDPISTLEGGLVWMEGDTTLAYASAQVGRRGTWLMLYLHPEAEKRAAMVIRQAAMRFQPSTDRPLLCCVRRYQEWLVTPLCELGFATLGSLAILVRHTTVRVAQPELQLIPATETALEATAPIAHSSLRES